ncbi:hypothetical protein MtrunA17_Chr8g0364571 [Medicago truncatula]|uniref:Uncharacterized protein n=1 Tax=Medicago truncatula TaxID=3880 RepID=A0A072TRC3_MEDTR|nr:hypothetical protein MTR_8g063175 [Medicago truncatula]RHN41294.1 hypothetical protein MtrunA17_Chr8g0364571 [Medicago truncatula]
MVMLNFHKISLRPPWSIFIISQTPKIIFKSNQCHWKANTIIYNFHVYTKSQFKTETCEKDARTRNRGCCQSAAREASKFTRCGELRRTNLREQTRFHSKSPNFINPNLIGNSTYVYSTA